MTKKKTKQEKPKIKKTSKTCPICKNNGRTYSSSAFGRHIRTVHGPKWTCNFCFQQYCDKNSHKICFEKEKYLLASFIINLAPQKLSTPKISPESLNYSFIFEDYNNFYYSSKLKLGCCHFSNVYYGIDKNSRKEIAIKFSKNKEKIVDYDREKHILEILKSKDFYPKISSMSRI